MVEGVPLVLYRDERYVLLLHVSKESSLPVSRILRLQSVIPAPITATLLFVSLTSIESLRRPSQWDFRARRAQGPSPPPSPGYPRPRCASGGRIRGSCGAP